MAEGIQEKGYPTESFISPEKPPLMPFEAGLIIDAFRTELGFKRPCDMVLAGIQARAREAGFTGRETRALRFIAMLPELPISTLDT
jgi:hypothetical protein